MEDNIKDIQKTLDRHEILINKNTDNLDRHENMINKNTEDIEQIKIDSSTQNNEVAHLKESIEKLTSTIEKTVDKFDSYRFGESSKKNDTWKWVVASIMLPLITFLLNYIANHAIK